MPIRLVLILSAMLLAAVEWPAAASAASANASARTVPSHRSPHAPMARGRHGGSGHHRAPNHVNATFNQRSHTHGTMAGPRM